MPSPRKAVLGVGGWKKAQRFYLAQRSGAFSLSGSNRYLLFDCVPTRVIVPHFCFLRMKRHQPIMRQTLLYWR